MKPVMNVLSFFLVLTLHSIPNGANSPASKARTRRR
jgi:hypothetical protein